MRRLAACIALAAAVVATVGAAHGGVIKIFARASASGAKAHAVAVAPHIGRSYKNVSVYVRAFPNQLVKAGWASRCGGPGMMSRGTKSGVGRTPYTISVPWGVDRPCSVAADATLLGRGKLIVEVVAR